MPQWNRVVIIGVGLLGGSVALAMKQRGLAKCIAGTGRNMQRLHLAKSAGLIDEAYTEIEPATLDADLVIACTPVQNIAQDILASTRWAKPSTLFTDVGSTKGAIISELSGKISRGHFVGSHPLAGSEKSGFENARPDLFENRLTIITPTENTPPIAIEATKALWNSLGADVREMSPPQHDAVLAVTSHLPHLIAAALAANTPRDHLDFVAAGWRDCTRIAAGDIQLWYQILRENRSPVLQALENFGKVLQGWRAALENDQPEQILSLLELGKQIRDQAVGN